MQCVPKNPRPSDFCGCPPCPLCFDWVTGSGNRIAGIIQMMRDILAREATAEEEKVLYEAGERIHEANLKSKLDQDEILARVDEMNEINAMQMQVDDIIKTEVKARAAPAPKPLNPINLDNIEDRQKLEPVEAPEREKVLAYDPYTDRGYLPPGLIPPTGTIAAEAEAYERAKAEKRAALKAAQKDIERQYAGLGDWKRYK